MLEDKLKDLIIEKYGSIRQFAFKIDIPYTTVDSILKRGLDNSNVGNVIRMCKALDISIDNLLDNKEIISNISLDNGRYVDISNDISQNNDEKNNNDISLMSQYKLLFDKDDKLTQEQKNFMIDFLTEKHKKIDEYLDKE